MEKSVFYGFLSLVSVYGQKIIYGRIYGFFLTRFGYYTPLHFRMMAEKAHTDVSNNDAMRWTMRRCDGRCGDAMGLCYRITTSSIASPHRLSHRLIVHRLVVRRIASSCIASPHSIAPSPIASPHRASHRPIASPRRPSHRLIMHRIASSCIPSPHSIAPSCIASLHRPSRHRPSHRVIVHRIASLFETSV